MRNFLELLLEFLECILLSRLSETQKLKSMILKP